MPTEVRRIIFSNAELYAALVRHLAGTGSGLSAGTITQVWGDARHDLIKIDVATSEDEPAVTLEFSTAQVGEALIGHCLANQIPLPRAFSKSLIITDNHAALEITNATGGLIAKATMWSSLRRRLVDALAILSARKLSLVRSCVYGLAFQIVVIWLSDRAWGADQWGRVTFDLDSGTWQGMAIAVSALLPGPSLFVAGAWVRNAIVKRAKRPYGYAPKTLDFQFDERHRQAAPLSTAFLALTLTFLIVVLGGPLVISLLGQALQPQNSTPSVALSSPTPGGAFSLFPSSQSGALMESRSFGGGLSADRSTNSGSPPPAMLVQNGTVRLADSSVVEVTFPKQFGDTPNVVIVNAGTSSAEASPLIDDVTPTSFEIRRPAGAARGRLPIEVEWVAEGPSPK